MNGEHYQVEVLFKNPDMARDVHSRYRTDYQSRGMELSDNVKLNCPRLYLTNQAHQYLISYIQDAARRHRNPRYKIKSIK